MANWVLNILKIIGSEEQVKEVMEFMKCDELGIGTIDFNKITPMPRWVYGSSPGTKDISDSDKEKWGEENTLYGWRIRNWGTIWNAFEQPDTRNTKNTIYFNTAWVAVPALIQKIAWIFPNITVEYEFVDRGSGKSGTYRFKYNEILEEEIEEIH